MEATLIKKSNIVQRFAQASVQRDIEFLEYLLDDAGKFEKLGKNDKSKVTDKQGFLKWYSEKLKTTSIRHTVFDQCIGCHFGNSVVIFNDGLFPVRTTHFADRSKCGLVLSITDEGKIDMIEFCYLFLKTDNEYNYKCERAKKALQLKIEFGMGDKDSKSKTSD